MRFTSFWLSILLVLQFATFDLPSLAASSSSTTTTTTTTTSVDAPLVVEANVPVNKIGALFLSEGLAIMTSNTIEVQGKVDHGPKQSVLNGVVFNTTQLGTSSGGKVTGFVHFKGGPKLDRLNESNCPERIDLNDGSKFVGHLIAITQDAVDFQDASNVSHHIAMSSVQSIHSPFVYSYSMNASALGSSPSSPTVQKISFVSTCKRVEAAGTKHTSTGVKVIALAVVIVIVATAIAVPVAVGVATHHHHTTPVAFFPTHGAPPPPTTLGGGAIIIPGLRNFPKGGYGGGG